MEQRNGQNQVSENDCSSSMSGVTITSQNLTTNNALSYLKEIKETFPNQSEKFEKFLQIMKDFKATRIDTVGVVESVKGLFKGHNNLLSGINIFLPNGYEIIVQEDEDPLNKGFGFEEAKIFAKKMMIRFQGNDHVCISFLNILKMHKENQEDIGEVYNEVATLFKNHQDLLDEFTRFLPHDDVVQEAA